MAILRMADALQAGVLRRTLYAIRDAGRVEALARSLYRLTGAPPLSNPDLVTVAAKIPPSKRKTIGLKHH
jgi:hypothetical protein